MSQAARAKRFAADIWSKYKNNGQLQDVIETLMGAGISAGGQLILTDMDAAEVAGSTAIGAGLALAARPLGARMGYAVGRGLDKTAPNIGNRLAPYVPVTRQGLEQVPLGLKQMGVPERGIEGLMEMAQAKRNQNAFRPDGTERGNAETILGYYGRTRGDNLAQYGFAALSPFLYGNSGSATDETGQGYATY